MSFDPNTQPYQISNEYDIANILAHFDSNYIFDVIEDKLEKLSFATTLPEPNIVSAFETNFKEMYENYPGDSQNIKMVREQVYRDVIRILTAKFNLSFNTTDDSIDLYTAAKYLYDFVVCNRNTIMVNFFAAFIINNKDSLCATLNMEDFRKSKDSASAYGKRIYSDNKYALISANISTVINYISGLDITLVNIFQSTYVDYSLVAFLDNCFSDNGNFFKDFYCSILQKPEELPIVITNIRLKLQSLVGDISQDRIDEYLSYGITGDE